MVQQILLGDQDYRAGFNSVTELNPWLPNQTENFGNAITQTDIEPRILRLPNFRYGYSMRFGKTEIVPFYIKPAH